MSSCRRAFTAPLTILLGVALGALGGCVYEQEGPPDLHFQKFETKPPRGDTVTVCHAYGCKEQTPFTFSQQDIAEISALMARTRRNDSPAEERRAMAYAIGWMERRVAPTVGTATDRPSMDFIGSGVSSQQDCVDEATNTTSYLLVLDRHGLIRHHIVERPFAKDSINRWTHWAALIEEKGTGARYAIDSSSGPNGDNPTVQAEASFYVPDSAADNTPPETGIASAEPGGQQTRAAKRPHRPVRAHERARLCGRTHGVVALVRRGLGRWRLEQLKRELDRAEGAAMVGADAMRLDGAGMLRRAVTLVRLPAIAAIAARELHHHPVARHLGDDRGGGDRERAAVAADHGARFAGEPARRNVAVDQRRGGGRLEPAIGGAHAP